MKNGGGEAKKLRVTYFGQDKNRSFDIYVTDQLLQSVVLNGAEGDRFFDVDYTLSESVRGEKVPTVKFVAKEGSVAGSVFYVRLLTQ